MDRNGPVILLQGGECSVASLYTPTNIISIDFTQISQYLSISALYQTTLHITDKYTATVRPATPPEYNLPACLLDKSPVLGLFFNKGTSLIIHAR